MSAYLSPGLSGAFESRLAEPILVDTLRIAIITETLPPTRLNLQPWRYLGDLAQSLRLEGHETTVVTGDSGMASWNGVPVAHHPDREDFRSAAGLRHLVAAQRVDEAIFRLTAGFFFSLHRRPREARSNGQLIGIFLRPLHSGRDLARRFLDPTLAPEIPLDRHHAAMYASRLLGTWPAAPFWVDGFVFLWESDRQCATAAGFPAASCFVVRHPFDPFYMERGPLNLGPRLSGVLPSVPRRVVFSGPPEATRGVEDVMRLAEGLPRDFPTQVVLLLRDPRFREPTVEHVRRGAHDVVSVRGLLSRDEIRAIYRESHVAVFPYRFVRTGLPLVALEAVAAGLPVVTTRVHPIRELEGRTGLVFARPRDPRDLARAVRSCFDGDQREEIRRKNEEWIRASPDWRTVAKTVISIGRGD